MNKYILIGIICGIVLADFILFPTSPDGTSSKEAIRPDTQDTGIDINPASPPGRSEPFPSAHY